MAGELLSWLGLITGVPLLLFGALLRSGEARLVPTEIVIVQGLRGADARWFAAGDFHERTLRTTERALLGDRDVCTAFVSHRDPSRMRLQVRRPITSVCLALGGVLAGAGLCGFAVSLLPMILG